MMCRHTHAEMSDIIRQCIIGAPQIASLKKSSKGPFSRFLSSWGIGEVSVKALIELARVLMEKNQVHVVLGN